MSPDYEELLSSQIEKFEQLGKNKQDPDIIKSIDFILNLFKKLKEKDKDLEKCIELLNNCIKVLGEEHNSKNPDTSFIHLLKLVQYLKSVCKNSDLNNSKKRPSDQNETAIKPSSKRITLEPLQKNEITPIKKSTKLEESGILTSTPSLIKCAKSMEAKSDAINNELEAKNVTFSKDEDAKESSSDKEEPLQLTELEQKKLDRIKKIDSFLQRLNKEIIELESKELDLDELGTETSTYLKENLLKSRFAKAYEKLVNLIRKHPHLVEMNNKLKLTHGAQFKTKVKFNHSRYTEVNEKITLFLNKEKKFPDFADIRECVIEANSQSDLNLDEKRIDEISKSSFEEIGRILKNRRIKDDKYVLKTRLESLNIIPSSANQDIISDDETDPAKTDKELDEKLKENMKQAKEKHDKIIDEFVLKQDKGDYEENSSDEKNEDEDDSSSDDYREIEIQEQKNKRKSGKNSLDLSTVSLDDEDQNKSKLSQLDDEDDTDDDDADDNSAKSIKKSPLKEIKTNSIEAAMKEIAKKDEITKTEKSAKRPLEDGEIDSETEHNKKTKIEVSEVTTKSTFTKSRLSDGKLTVQSLTISTSTSSAKASNIEDSTKSKKAERVSLSKSDDCIIVLD